jgi:transcriptional regulator with XRE-family HTH domain
VPGEQTVLMQGLGQRLRHRARELGLADAEVARRAGLSERRYGNYVTGAREPDLSTLVRIGKVLSLTPDEMLGVGKQWRRTDRDKLMARLVGAALTLEAEDVKLAVHQLEAFVAFRHRPKPGPLTRARRARS